VTEPSRPLWARAGLADMTNAASIIGSPRIKRSLLFMLFLRFESFPGRLKAGCRFIAVQGRFLLRSDAFLRPTSLSAAHVTSGRH
jgi:hypothetical protein